MAAIKSKIRPCLWYDNQAHEAATFYTSLFENSKITQVSHYTEAGPGPAGSVLAVVFELDGAEFMALNGGPMFTFNEAVSFQIDCTDQDEVDRLWAALTEGGEESQCGWLKDRFGLSWQVVPTALSDLMSDPDPRRVERVTKAMFGMRKIDISQLQHAAAAA
jgi:predicted 3-demethylubiquinone-9 3-methyltransferase (glyoxalase superfamily)